MIRLRRSGDLVGEVLAKNTEHRGFRNEPLVWVRITIYRKRTPARTWA